MFFRVRCLSWSLFLFEWRWMSEKFVDGTSRRVMSIDGVRRDGNVSLVVLRRYNGQKHFQFPISP